MKRTFSLILAIIMLVSTSVGIAFSVTAEEAKKCGVNVYYNYDSDSNTLTISGAGSMYNYDNGREVDVQYSPFYNNNDIKSIIIESGVTTVGACAFCGCENVESVTIPNTVSAIGREAFCNCKSLTSIVIPNSVSTIDTEAFYNCNNMTDITIGSGVTSIGFGAFNISTLKQVRYSGTVSNWQKVIVGENNFPNADIKCTNGIICKTHNFKTYLVKATTKSDGAKCVKCTVCGKVKSKTVIKKIASVKLFKTAYTFNGKAKKPAVTVFNSANNKITSYTVNYPKGRKNVGTYTVTIKFGGNYSGTVKRSFVINPQTVKKIDAKKVSPSKIAIAFKKVSGVSGYEIYQYNYQKNKYTLVKRTKKPARVTLKKKGEHTVKYAVRTYKKVNGKTYKSVFKYGSKKL